MVRSIYGADGKAHHSACHAFPPAFFLKMCKAQAGSKALVSVCHARKPLFRATSRDGKYKITLPCVVPIVCNFLCTKTKGEEISTLRWRGTFQLFVIPVRVLVFVCGLRASV